MVGPGSRIAAEMHLLGASVGTSWVSCCSSPSWPSLFRSLPKNCYVPGGRCAKQRDLIFGSAVPFSLFYTRGRKRSQVVQVFLLFLLQSEINYSKVWIISDWDTHPLHTCTNGLALLWTPLFLSCSNTTTMTRLLLSTGKPSTQFLTGQNQYFF